MLDDHIVYMEIPETPEGYKYELLETYVYHSGLFNRTKTVPRGRRSDGATHARDLGARHLPLLVRIIHFLYRRRKTNRTAAWWVHDEFCIDPYWDDGTPVTNFVASTVLAVILYSDGYWLEAYTWWVATLFGGAKELVEKHGRFFLKRGVPPKYDGTDNQKY